MPSKLLCRIGFLDDVGSECRTDADTTTLDWLSLGVNRAARLFQSSRCLGVARPYLLPSGGAPGGVDGTGVGRGGRQGAHKAPVAGQ